MNEHKAIITLINSLEIQKNQVREDALREGAKTFEEEVILKYIKLKNIKNTANHFKHLGITTKTGVMISPNYVSSLIKGNSDKVNEIFLLMAKEILETNKADIKKIIHYM
jgi:hypothetical protein